MTAVRRGCQIATYLHTLPDSDRTHIEDRLATYGQAPVIWRWLQSKGVLVSMSAVRTHKRRECACGHEQATQDMTAAA